MWVPRVVPVVDCHAIRIEGRRYPFKPEKLNHFFILAADVKTETAIEKANLVFAFLLPALVQPDPVSWLMGVGDGKSQRTLTHAKVCCYRSGKWRRTGYAYHKAVRFLVLADQRSCVGSAASFF